MKITVHFDRRSVNVSDKLSAFFVRMVSAQKSKTASVTASDASVKFANGAGCASKIAFNSSFFQVGNASSISSVQIIFVRSF